MKITEKNPVKLPRGFHFAGQPAHIFNEKFSRIVRLEFDEKSRYLALNGNERRYLNRNINLLIQIFK